MHDAAFRRGDRPPAHADPPESSMFEINVLASGSVRSTRDSAHSHGGGLLETRDQIRSIRVSPDFLRESAFLDDFMSLKIPANMREFRFPGWDGMFYKATSRAVCLGAQADMAAFELVLSLH